MKKIKTDFGSLINDRASLWKRVAAFLIDLFIIYLAASPLTALLAKEIGTDSNIDLNTIKNILYEQEKFDGVSGIVITIVAMLSLMGLFYWTMLEYYFKQSIGKMLMRISVVSLTRELKLWQVLVRNITKALSVTSLSILFLIDIIYMLFNANRQRLSEVISKTEVTNANE